MNWQSTMDIWSLGRLSLPLLCQGLAFRSKWILWLVSCFKYCTCWWVCKLEGHQVWEWGRCANWWDNRYSAKLSCIYQQLAHYIQCISKQFSNRCDSPSMLICNKNIWIVFGTKLIIAEILYGNHWMCQ